MRKVDLRRFAPGARAGVPHAERDFQRLVPGQLFGRQVQAGIGEGCVGKAVPEREGHTGARFVVIAVANIDAFVIAYAARAHGKVMPGRRVGKTHRPGFRQTAAGGLQAIQKPARRLAGALARKAQIQYGARVFHPSRFHRAAGGQQHHHARVHRGKAAQKGKLVARQAQVRAVVTLCLV